MSCCKCEEHHWPDPQRPVWADEEGKQYCVFHAPKDHKRLSLEAFNELVFVKIAACKALGKTDEACHLSGTVFPGGIEFARYGEKNPMPAVDFSTAVFEGPANFVQAKFAGPARFDGAVFEQAARFDLTMFEDQATFLQARFGGEARFDGATFAQTAAFDLAIMGGAANFNSAKLNGDVSFDLTMFTRAASFDNARIEGKASFHFANFAGQTRFDGTRFARKASFWSAEFNGRTSFFQTRFEGDARFQFAKFSDRTSFNIAHFEQKAIFSETSFDGVAKFTLCTSKMLLLFRNLHSVNELHFIGMDMATADFFHTSLARMQFQNVIWPMAPDEERYLLPMEALPDRTEEEKASHEEGQARLDGAAHLKAATQFYRQMKKLSRDDQNHAEAALWHYAEKEALLKYLAVSGRMSFHRIILKLYRMISRYGDDPKQAFKVLACLLMLLFGVLALGAWRQYGVPSPADFQEKALGFLRVFIQYTLFMPHPWSPPAAFDLAAIVLSRLVIPLQAIFLALALRNKLHR